MASEAERKLDCDLLARSRLLAGSDVVKEFVENYDHIRDSDRTPVHLENLNRIWEKFEEVQSKIELGDHPDRLDSHLLVRAEFFNQFCKLKGFLLALPSQRHQSHVTPSHLQQPTVHPVPRNPQKDDEAANVVVAGPSQSPVVSAVTTPPKPKPKPNAPIEEEEGDVSPRRHSPPRCPTPAKQSVIQRHQELASERSLSWKPVLPDLHAQEGSSCGVRSRPLEEEASTREAPVPIVRSNPPKKEPIPATSPHVGTSGSAHPAGVSLTSQVKATPVQGEEVQPPVVDLHEKESHPQTLPSSATLSTPMVASSVAATEEQFSNSPEPEEEEDVVRHADTTDVGIPTPEVSAEKISRKQDQAATSTPARRKIAPVAQPQAVQPTPHHSDPTDVGKPEVEPAALEGSAEKVLREQVQAATSIPARRKTTPVAQPHPIPHPAEVSPTRAGKHLSIGDGLPLEIGRIESIPACAPFVNVAHLLAISQPLKPSPGRLATLAAQPFCEMSRVELTPLESVPESTPNAFLTPLSASHQSLFSHSSKRARSML